MREGQDVSLKQERRVSDLKKNPPEKQKHNIRNMNEKIKLYPN